MGLNVVTSAFVKYLKAEVYRLYSCTLTKSVQLVVQIFQFQFQFSGCLISLATCRTTLFMSVSLYVMSSVSLFSSLHCLAVFNYTSEHVIMELAMSLRVNLFMASLFIVARLMA